ncbi:hypothetical protein BGV40_14615 [Methanosarcina sp. Ant1]|nr:hypothetical protein BGV40_14615 [Methanosarcina sp. Ant1]
MLRGRGLPAFVLKAAILIAGLPDITKISTRVFLIQVLNSFLTLQVGSILSPLLSRNNIQKNFFYKFYRTEDSS